MALFNKSSKPSPAVKPAPTAAKPAMAAAKPAPAPVAAPKAAAAATKPAIDPAERQRMIGEAAYYLAEKRGFAHGHHDADWATAEKQIDALLAKRR